MAAPVPEIMDILLSSIIVFRFEIISRIKVGF
jgi:hypothetical protein